MAPKTLVGELVAKEEGSSCKKEPEPSKAFSKKERKESKGSSWKHKRKNWKEEKKGPITY